MLWNKNFIGKIFVRWFFRLCGAILGTPRYLVQRNLVKKYLEKILWCFLFHIQKKIEWCFSSKILKKWVKVRSFDSWLLIGQRSIQTANQEPGIKGSHFDSFFQYLWRKTPFYFLLNMKQKTSENLFQIFFHQISLY